MTQSVSILAVTHRTSWPSRNYTRICRSAKCPGRCKWRQKVPPPIPWPGLHTASDVMKQFVTVWSRWKRPMAVTTNTLPKTMTRTRMDMSVPNSTICGSPMLDWVSFGHDWFGDTEVFAMTWEIEKEKQKYTELVKKKLTQRLVHWAVNHLKMQTLSKQVVKTVQFNAKIMDFFLQTSKNDFHLHFSFHTKLQYAFKVYRFVTNE